MWYYCVQQIHTIQDRDYAILIMYNQLKLITCIISRVKLLFEDYLPKELEPI
jgi:hypothetical protein